MYQKFEIRSVKRNQVGIENNMKIGSIGLEESGRNRGNLRLLKENSIFLLHILIDWRKGLISRVLKNKIFWNFWTTFSAESFEKQFLWYDMYVHDFKWFLKPNFSKKKFKLCQNFFNCFFPHSPKCIKHIKKFNFGRPYRLNMYQI